MSEHTPEVVRVSSEPRLDDTLAVRHRVFVDEQGVPPALELDEFDSLDAATHFAAYDGEEAVGAARLRPYDGPMGATTAARAKVERVAVLAERRGEGIGTQLMDAVEAEAREQGYDALVLHAQTDVEGFYDARGYRREGSEFLEAGIPHVEMFRNL